MHFYKVRALRSAIKAIKDGHHKERWTRR